MSLLPNVLEMYFYDPPLALHEQSLDNLPDLHIKNTILNMGKLLLLISKQIKIQIPITISVN